MTQDTEHGADGAESEALVDAAQDAATAEVRARVLGALEMDFEEADAVPASKHEVLPEDAPLDLRLAYKPKNDLGNSRRLLERFGDDLIYVRDVGWYAWVKTHWSFEMGDRKAQMFAQRVSELIQKEADALEAWLSEVLKRRAEDNEFRCFDDPKGEKAAAAYAAAEKENAARVLALRKFGIASGNTARIAAMQTELIPRRLREMDQLDKRKDLFNVKNGTLMLHRDRPVELVPHERTHLITRIASVDYEGPEGEDSPCPTWDTFFSEVQPQVEVRAYLYRCWGLSLSGYDDEQFLQLNWGKGANGKSTAVEALLELFGTYGMLLPFASLLRDDKRRGAEATPDLADLPGRRFVMASETEEGTQFSVAMIKTLTERLKMKVRHLNQNFFEFTPQHHLVLMFNDPPQVRATDDGTWRRLQMTPWRQRYIEPREQERYPDLPVKDPTLPGRLRKELPGVLVRLVQGFEDWCRNRLKPPDAVLQATDEYRKSNDPVGEFLDAATMVMPDKEVTGKQLYEAYKIWADASGLMPMTNARFGSLLKKRLKSKKSGVIKYEGVIISPQWLDDNARDRTDLLS